VIAAVRLTSSRGAALLVVGLSGLVIGCSSGDGTDLDSRTPSPSTSATRIAASDEATVPTGSTPSDPNSPDPTSSTNTAATSPGGTEPATSEPSSAAPETGVPGLDAEDAFCAAWSRFGGSFQVVAVNAAFGDAPSELVLEVAAAPTVAGAYLDLGEHWPEEIADERAAALEGALGPFARRLAYASDALAGAGATATDLDALATAWVAALGERDPDDPVLQLELSAELRTLVDAAGATYLDEVGPWADDESLVTEVEIPATNQYLADNCPDQGTLAGQEVGD
jgi:hypothetical protein